MKYINNIIILLSILVLAFTLPYLFNMATSQSGRRSFSYYSSVNNMFCTNTFVNGKYIRKSENNEVYNRKQADSILPMLNYRQLLADLRMPDSIQNQPVDLKEIARNNFFFRYRPVNKNKESIALYPLFESMSGRVKLSMPGDVFRINSRIEFIDPVSNTIKEDKSSRFTNKFIAENFSFPAKKIWGNTSSRKSYDEGYFILDSTNKLYHLKMIQGECILKNTNYIGNIEYLMPQEPGNREFYAFFFEQNNVLKMISTKNYEIHNIPIPKINFQTDKFGIMSNMFFWNVKVSYSKSDSLYALTSKTKTRIAKISLPYTIEQNKLFDYIFPFHINLEDGNSKYVKPIVIFGSFWACLINLILSLAYFMFNKMRRNRICYYDYILISFTGIFGLLSVIIFKNH